MKKIAAVSAFVAVISGFALRAGEDGGLKPLYEVRGFGGSGRFQVIHSAHVDETTGTLTVLSEAPLRLSVFNTFDGSSLREIEIFGEAKTPLSVAGCGGYFYVGTAEGVRVLREDGRIDRDRSRAFPGGAERLLCDRQGNLVFLDSDAGAVSKYSSDGKPVFEVRRGEKGQAPRLESATDVAVDYTGAVYIADYEAGDVKKFSPEGKYLGVFGGDDRVARSEVRCSLVSADARRNIWVYDDFDGKISVFDSFGFPAGEIETGGAVDSAAMIHVDRLGRLFVLDAGDGAVKVFGVQGGL
ncbi:MAG: hypothetical protein AB1742_09805 [bacterium]